MNRYMPITGIDNNYPSLLIDTQAPSTCLILRNGSTERKLKVSSESRFLNLFISQENSMNTKPHREFADIGLTPIGSLENTATVLGGILGITFKEDNEGTYDEYPAFLACTLTHKYALLGVPLPEDDLRDEPSNDFNLLVSSIDNDSDHPETDISEQLIRHLMKTTDIRCWRLT